MNYQKIYHQLIERARVRIPKGYVEDHHILPKCMGGNDDVNNIVSLYPEEHYVAHLLLLRIHPNVPGLIYAANRVGNCGNKHYGWVRRKVAQQISIDLKARVAKWKLEDPEGFSKEQSRRGSFPKKKRDGYKKPKSEVTKIKMSESAKLRPRVACTTCGKIVTIENMKNHIKVHKRTTNDLQCV